MHVNEITKIVIGAAIEVHKNLGPGLLESAYEECLARELALQGVAFTKQEGLPLEYKGVKCDVGYRIDLFVEGLVVIEVKSVEAVIPVHKAQLLTYLKHTGAKVGLLINFNECKLTEGITRLVYKFNG